MQHFGLLCVMWALALPAAAGELTLAADGQATMGIVPAAPADQPAAEELARYLGLLSGAKFEVQPAFDGPVLYVGDLSRAGVSADDLGPDGFILKRADADFVLAGATPLATSYAVTRLLERLGCGWYFAGQLGEVVPSPRARLTLDDATELRRPDFRIRWVGHDEWSRRNYGNVNVKTPGEYKLKWFVHTWLDLVPPERYFDEHPEFFPLRSGVRCDPRAKPEARYNLCASNPAVAAAAAKTVDELVTADPTIDMISIDPEDTQVFCECPECQALVNPGEPYELRNSKLVFQFTNRVAAIVAKQHPHVLLKTIAYHTYVRPPADPEWRPGPNVAIQFCRFMDHNHALDDPRSAQNRGFNAWYEEWRGRTNQILFYEYYYKASWLSLPWPICRMLSTDLPRFHRDGLLGLSTQYTGNFATHALGYWLATRLLFDSSADVPVLVEQYCRELYGPAGATVLAYYQRLEQAAEESGLELASQQPFAEILELFTPGLIASLDGLLATAAAEADTDPRRERVRMLQTGIEHTHRLTAYFQACVDAGAPAKYPWNNMTNAPKLDLATAEAAAGRVKELLAAPAGRQWVGKAGTYLDRALTPLLAWQVLHPSAPLTKPAWRGDRPAAKLPAKLALWVYGNDWDRDGEAAEHEVRLRSVGAETWLKVGDLAPAGVDGNRVNLAVVYDGLESSRLGPPPWEVEILNLPGGPYGSTLYGVWLLPSEGPLGSPEATRRVEESFGELRSRAVAFSEAGRNGLPCREEVPTRVVLEP